MKHLLLILAFFLPFTAFASVQVIPTIFTGSTAATRYMPIGGVTVIFSNETIGNINYVAPVSGSFSNLRVHVNTAPGGSNTLVITFRKNKQNTPVTCTLVGSATTCADTTHSASFSQGDFIDYGMVSLTSFIPGISIANDFTPTTANDTFYAESMTAGISSTIEQYTVPIAINAVYSGSNVSIPTWSMIFPEAGTVDQLTASTTAPGAGKSWVFTTMVNAATTTSTCTVDGNAPNWCADNVNAVSIAAGDYLSIADVPLGTPASSLLAVGMRFIPSTAGNFDFFSGMNSGTADPATTVYHSIQGAIGGGTEAASAQVVNNMTITKMVANVRFAPGGAHYRTITLRDNGADTAASCIITSAATSCTWTGTLSVGDGDLLDIADAPDSLGTTQTSFSAGIVATRGSTAAVRGSPTVVIQNSCVFRNQVTIK